MKRRRAVLAVALITGGAQVPPPPVVKVRPPPVVQLPPPVSSDATLLVPETMVNGLVGRLGAISDSGFYQPSQMMAAASLQNCQPFGFLGCSAAKGRGVPLLLCDAPEGGVALAASAGSVTWQWWIVNPHFTLTSGAMSFTATLRAQVAGQTSDVTNTVAAGVTFDPTTNALQIKVTPLQVPLQYEGATITLVDVAKLYSVSIPIEPQPLSIPMPDGSTKTLTARAASVSPRYEAGAIRVDVKLGF